MVNGGKKNEKFKKEVIFSMFLFMATVEVQAAKIKIVRDENPDCVTVLSLFDEEYSIDVDEENEIGYVVYTSNGEDEILGTCTVIVINSQNPNGYVLCNSEVGSSRGTLTITIINELTGEGYVSSVTGDLGYLFGLNTEITLK
ncbi:MAG: hypothetical protein PHX46_02695 [Bacilli bacterium]|nr:hypothetical protein [Bacilli bacterium]